MYITIEKDVEKIQRQEVNFPFLKQFWGKRENRSIILFIYNGESILTLLSYMDFIDMEDETALGYYLDCVHNNKFWGYCDAVEISEALEQMPYVTYLILEKNEVSGKYTFAYARLDAEVQYYVSRIKECLENKGIRVFGVNIPMVQEIEPDRRTNSSLCYVMYSRLITSDEFRLPQNIDKITNLSEDDLKPVKDLWYKKLGNAEKKIYLVGPCIVTGTGNPPGERLGDVLYLKLQELGLDREYEIEFVPLQMDKSMKLYNILEYTITNRDLVIIVLYNMYECELDLTPIYNSWEGKKWLYQDKPIHTTITGNEMIAENIIEKIIKPAHESGGGNVQINMWHGEPQFSPVLEYEIDRYIKRVREIQNFPVGSKIGAIVMNCNPFTLGHRHLIEYSAKKVDYLYIFVVEEDLSVFPFHDRYSLIREGIRDISNIVLVPSGQFIISRVTFFSYFKKDMYTDHASSEEDVYIFARYIARGLGITRRFVGEEPADIVTDSYNRKMKEIFPKYGIELIEIRRKESDHGKIISASSVRSLMEEGRWEEIEQIVPFTTLEYLKKNKENLLRRNKKKQLSLASGEDVVNEFNDRVCCEDRVIVYSIGEDTEQFLKKIPEKVKKRFVYADKMASKGSIYFHGKLVVAPEELLSKYREYTIAIPTVKYGPEIYRQFVQMGLDMSRCIFNTRVPQ